MNYETKLAAALGSLPSTKMEKVSYDLSKLSIEDLDKLASADGESFVDSAAEEIIALEKVAMADRWGRELAYISFEKTAVLAALSPVLKAGIKPVGKAMNWAAQGAGKNMMHGAVAGGVLGGAKGLISDPGIDPQTGQDRSRIQAAMSGALGGAALGAGAAGAAGAGLRAAGASQGATGKYLNASQRIFNRSAAGKAQQAATAATGAAANPAAAAAASGRPPPSAESADRFKKLQADMMARREAEQTVGKGLNPQEQAARLKAGKGSQVGGMKSELMPEISNPNPAAEYAQRVTGAPQPENAGQALSGMKGMTPERQAQIEARQAARRAQEAGAAGHAATPQGTEAAIRANAAKAQAQAQNRTPMGAMRNLANRLTGPSTAGVMGSP